MSRMCSWKDKRMFIEMKVSLSLSNRTLARERRHRAKHPRHLHQCDRNEMDKVTSEGVPGQDLSTSKISHKHTVQRGSLRVCVVGILQPQIIPLQHCCSKCS